MTDQTSSEQERPRVASSGASSSGAESAETTAHRGATAADAAAHDGDHARHGDPAHDATHAHDVKPAHDEGRHQHDEPTHDEPTHDESTREESKQEESKQDEQHDQRQDDEASDHEDEEEKARAAEDFAREHDPADHDIAAGEEFRQRGDWTAEDGDGPQVMTADDVEHPALAGGTGADSSHQSREGHGHESHGHESQESHQGNTSSLEDVRDGGYGVGSAAPIADGVVPLGHPIKAWQDTMTFLTPDHPGYGDAEPHVWFFDVQAAQNAGFRSAD